LPSARLDEGHAIEPLNLVVDSDPPVKVDQIGAQLEQDMLAVVDNLASARVFVGTGAASDIGTTFEYSDLKPTFSEGAASRKAGEATTHDGDGERERFGLAVRAVPAGLGHFLYFPQH
jgi:hypothetical protein